MRRSGVKPPILLVGAGRMGGAMLRGWLAQGLGPVIAVEPKPHASLRKLDDVHFVPAIEDVPFGHVRACVIALKPQILRTEAARLKPIAARGTTTISIAAGTSIATLKNALGRDAKILRAMPNTPGAIGKGISALYAPKNISPGDKKLAEQLLAPLGETIWVASEKLIDMTTAVSAPVRPMYFLC
ncbi:MAG: hypothetical protein WDM89_12965 [Rhizomicrobium sp.]